MTTASNVTVVTMVVDESGSMAMLHKPTMDGFNEYVTNLQGSLKGEKVYFSAITFDTRGVRKLQVGSPLENAIKLSVENYQPNGGTPLLDAAGKAILATDEVMKAQAGTKAIVVIQTDGQENASKEFDLAKLKTLIEERTAKGWQFVFIGAGIDAYAQGSQMGFSTANTMSYTADAVATMDAFAATASNAANFTRGLASTMAYSVGQKAKSGDKYAPVDTQDAKIDLTTSSN